MMSQSFSIEIKSTNDSITQQRKIKINNRKTGVEISSR